MSDWDDDEGSSGMNKLGSALYFVVGIATAMTGYQIHGSLFWAVVDFFLCPLAWAKWLLCHQVSVSVLKHAFGFLLS